MKKPTLTVITGGLQALEKLIEEFAVNTGIYDFKLSNPETGELDPIEQAAFSEAPHMFEKNGQAMSRETQADVEFMGSDPVADTFEFNLEK